MITLEVLGPGCANCQRLEANVHEALARAGIEADVRHITDYREIAARGVMSTPGLIVDGIVVSTGRVPSADEIGGWLSPSVTVPST